MSRQSRLNDAVEGAAALESSRAGLAQLKDLLWSCRTIKELRGKLVTPLEDATSWLKQRDDKRDVERDGKAEEAVLSWMRVRGWAPGDRRQIGALMDWLQSNKLRRAAALAKPPEVKP